MTPRKPNSLRVDGIATLLLPVNYLLVQLLSAAGIAPHTTITLKRAEQACGNLPSQ